MMRRPRTTARALAVVLAVGLTAPGAALAQTPPAAAAGTGSPIRIGVISPAPVQFQDVGPAPYPLSNALERNTAFETLQVAQFLFRGLYRYDSVLTPVPDLADRPCDVDAAGLTFTCHLGSARFTNGDPVTADDVAFSYRLAASPNCPFGLGALCLAGDNAVAQLADAQAIDASTVRLTLAAPTPQFLTVALPQIWIDSKRVIEQQYDALRATAETVGGDVLKAAAEQLDAALNPQDPEAPTPDCEALRIEAEPLVLRAGFELPDKVLYGVGPGAAFDACLWDQAELLPALYSASDMLASSGVDAIATIYPMLPLRLHPVGSGAWQVDEAASQVGRRLVLTAAPTAQHPPATSRIEFVTYPSRRDEAEGLRNGEIDWMRVPSNAGSDQGGADIYRLVQSIPGLDMVDYPDPSGFVAINFNTRPDRLFGDRNVRQALALCIDKPKTVAAATDGQGEPAWGSIAPDMWAANPDLPQPARDVAHAKALLEASGWQLNGKVYEKDGAQLKADIWVPEKATDRLKFADLVALQARDCGFDLTVRPGTGLGVVFAYPFVLPDGSPFDALVTGSFGPIDPDVGETVWMTYPYGPPDPSNVNVYGYSNPQVDALVQAARTTNDIVERARDYRQEQAIIAADLPNYFAWYRRERVALRHGLTSLAGPLPLDRPGWDWQLDQLVMTPPAQ